MWKRILLGVVIVAGLLGSLLFSRLESGSLKVSGFIEADAMRLGSRVGGRVLRVHVDEGDAVAADRLLVELEPFTLDERKAEAEALLSEKRAEYARLARGYRPEEQGQADARVERLKARLEKAVNGPRPEEIAAAEEEVKEAEARLKLARSRRKRVAKVFETGAATPEEMDEADSELEVARATVAAREQELALLRKGTRPEEIAEARAALEEAREAARLIRNGFREEEITKARAAVEAAEARSMTISQQIDELKIRAPSSGIVQAIDLEPGDLVRADQPVISLLDRSELWVRAYVPENELDIELDQRVWVTVDSYPGETFPARITFVSEQGEFTPRNIQTPEERSKQVFRIKATLEEGQDRLRPGMAADVWFDEP